MIRVLSASDDLTGETTTRPGRRGVGPRWMSGPEGTFRGSGPPSTGEGWETRVDPIRVPGHPCPLAGEMPCPEPLRGSIADGVFSEEACYFELCLRPSGTTRHRPLVSHRPSFGPVLPGDPSRPLPVVPSHSQGFGTPVKGFRPPTRGRKVCLGLCREFAVAQPPVRPTDTGAHTPQGRGLECLRRRDTVLGARPRRPSFRSRTVGRGFQGLALLTFGDRYR